MCNCENESLSQELGPSILLAIHGWKLESEVLHDRSGWTALMLAASKHHFGLVRALLDAKADPSARMGGPGVVGIGRSKKPDMTVGNLTLEVVQLALVFGMFLLALFGGLELQSWSKTPRSSDCEMIVDCETNEELRWVKGQLDETERRLPRCKPCRGHVFFWIS